MKKKWDSTDLDLSDPVLLEIMPYFKTLEEWTKEQKTKREEAWRNIFENPDET